MKELRLAQIELEIAKELISGLVGVGRSPERVEQLEDEKKVQQIKEKKRIADQRRKLQSNNESRGEP